MIIAPAFLSLRKDSKQYFTLHGELLGYPDLADDISNTSINLGVVSTENGVIKVTFDMRFPVKTNGEKVVSLLDISDEHNKLEVESVVEPLYFDKNTPFIRALKKAYEDVSGDKESEMLAIGGGTYAKAIHNCIAWGCEFAGEDNHIHDINERLSIESFKKQVEFYVEAIRNLNEIED